MTPVPSGVIGGGPDCGQPQRYQVRGCRNWLYFASLTAPAQYQNRSRTSGATRITSMILAAGVALPAAVFVGAIVVGRRWSFATQTATKHPPPSESTLVYGCGGRSIQARTASWASGVFGSSEVSSTSWVPVAP